jgi:hypothetical protein
MSQFLRRKLAAFLYFEGTLFLTMNRIVIMNIFNITRIIKFDIRKFNNNREVVTNFKGAKMITKIEIIQFKEEIIIDTIHC